MSFPLEKVGKRNAGCFIPCVPCQHTELSAGECRLSTPGPCSRIPLGLGENAHVSPGSRGMDTGLANP